MLSGAEGRSSTQLTMPASRPGGAGVAEWQQHASPALSPLPLRGGMARPRTSSPLASPGMQRSAHKAGACHGTAATLSSGLMHERATRTVGHALPTPAGLSRHFDFDGLRSSGSGGLLLRPLLNSGADWHDDDRALYGRSGRTQRAWHQAEYEAETELSSPSYQQRGHGPKMYLAESDTRLSWPRRSSPGAGGFPPLQTFGEMSQAAEDDDWDGRALHREFQHQIAAAREHASNPEMRFEPAEGGMGGEAASADDPPSNDCAREGRKGAFSGQEIDLAAVSAKMNDLKASKGPRTIPDSLKERYDYFLEMSDGAAWSRLDDVNAKTMSFDMVEEERVFSEMLERAISMAESRIPGCGAVLRASFEWFAQVPADKVMLARKDRWRRPHRDAFNDLESRLQRLTEELAQAQRAADEADAKVQAQATQAKQSAERAALAEKALRSMEIELRETIKVAAKRLEEATVAQQRSQQQTKDFSTKSAQHEKDLRELEREQRIREGMQEENSNLKTKVEELEQQVNAFVMQLKGKRSAKRATKIEMRNKIVLAEVQKYSTKHRVFSGRVDKERARILPGLGKSISRSMEMAQKEDREAESLNGPGSGTTVKNETETLIGYTKQSQEFAQSALVAITDHDVCINDLAELMKGFEMADQQQDSDSDGEFAELEQLKEDNDLLLNKVANKDRLLEVKDKELILRQESIDRLSEGLREYEVWKENVDNEVERIKNEAEKKVYALEQQLEDMRETVKEVKKKEQEYKDTIREQEKVVAKQEKEISQFEMKLSQFKKKVETQEQELEAKAQKIGVLESKIEEMKADLQGLKDEIKENTKKLKEQATMMNELKVALEQQQQINQQISEKLRLEEERFRALMKEFESAKASAEKAAKEKKEALDKLMSVERECKAKLVEAEKMQKKAEAEVQVCKKELEKMHDLQDEIKKIEVFKARAEEAESKLAAAKDFLDNFEEQKAEIERLKNVEAKYARMHGELENVRQTLENSGGTAEASSAEGPDHELLAGMRVRGGKSIARKRSLAIKTYQLEGKGSALGPWVPRDLMKAGAENQQEMGSKVALVRTLVTAGMKLASMGKKIHEDVSISGRMLDFVRVAERHFDRAEQKHGRPALVDKEGGTGAGIVSLGGLSIQKGQLEDGVGGRGGAAIGTGEGVSGPKTMSDGHRVIDHKVAAETMTQAGLSKAHVERALEMVAERNGPWFDKNTFSEAMHAAQSLAAWSKMDIERKGKVSTDVVISWLKDCGYSDQDCELLIYSADPGNSGEIEETQWVMQWSRFLASSMEVHAALPATSVVHVTPVGVPPAKLFRSSSGVGADGLVFSKGNPQAATQTSETEGMGRDATDPNVAGGGMVSLQPTAMGKLLDMKDVQIAAAEASYKSAVEHIAQLLAFIKANVDHHEAQMAQLTSELKLLRFNAPSVTHQSTMKSRLEVAPVQGEIANSGEFPGPWLRGTEPQKDEEDDNTHAADNVAGSIFYPPIINLCPPLSTSYQPLSPFYQTCIELLSKSINLYGNCARYRFLMRHWPEQVKAKIRCHCMKRIRLCRYKSKLRAPSSSTWSTSLSPDKEVRCPYHAQ